MTQAVSSPPAPLTAIRRKVRLGPVVERWIGWAILALGGAWVIWSFSASPKQFFEALVVGVNQGTLYALIALGYTMVYGIIELINFAHGDLFMLGTIISMSVFVNFMDQHKLGSWGGSGTLALAMIISMVLCSALNVFTEFIAYRRLRNAPKLAPLITAVGFSFIFQDIGQFANGSGQKNWPVDLGLGGPKIGGLELYHLLIVGGVTVPLLLLMSFIVTRTKQGKAMRAVAADRDGARLMGINVNRTISFTFALGGALAGAAGTLFVSEVSTTRYDQGLTFGLIAFTAAVLGGIGNLVGAVVGGLLIGVIEQLSNGAPHGLGQQWNLTVIFTILITLMVFKPEGILGTRTTEKV